MVRGAGMGTKGEEGEADGRQIRVDKFASLPFIEALNSFHPFFENGLDFEKGGLNWGKGGKRGMNSLHRTPFPLLAFVATGEDGGGRRNESFVQVFRLLLSILFRSPTTLWRFPRSQMGEFWDGPFFAQTCQSLFLSGLLLLARKGEKGAVPPNSLRRSISPEQNKTAACNTVVLSVRQTISK